MRVDTEDIVVSKGVGEDREQTLEKLSVSTQTNDADTRLERVRPAVKVHHLACMTKLMYHRVKHL